MTSGYLVEPGVRRLSQETEARYTTLDLLARERQLSTEPSGEAARGVVSSELFERVLVWYQPALNDDQAAAVRTAASTGRGVEVVQALAGTGKTTMIGALAACYGQDAWCVVGAADRPSTARQLRNIAEIPAGTIRRSATPGSCPRFKPAAGWPVFPAASPDPSCAR